MASPRSSRRTRAQPPAPAPAHPAPSARAPLGLPLVAVGLGLLHLVLVAAAFNPTPHVGGDNAAYVSLAQALLEGRGYVEAWDPAAAPHAQYPPAFPLLLAAGMGLGLTPWVGLKALVAAFSVAAVVLTVLWLGRTAPRGVAVGAGLVLAAAPGVVDQAYWVLSDVPFWAFTALALLAASYAVGDPAEEGRRTDGARSKDRDRSADGALSTDEAASTDRASSADRAGTTDLTPPTDQPPSTDRSRAQSIAWSAVLVVAVVLAYFTRSAGLPLFVAVALVLAFRRRWVLLGATTAAVGVPALLWSVRASRLGADPYLSAFRMLDPYRPELGPAGAGDLLARIPANGWRYVSIHLPELLTGGGVLGVVLSAVVVALAAWGWIVRLRHRSLPVVFLPLYAGLLLVWPPTWSGERLLLPLLPILFLFAGEGVRAASGRLGIPRAAGWALVGVALLAGLPAHAEQVRVATLCRLEHAAGIPAPCRPPVWADFLGGAAEAGRVLPRGTVVLSRKPTLYHVFSGHPSRLYPLTADPDSFFRAAAEAGAGYVVADRLPDLAGHYLRPVVQARPDRFCIVEELSLPEATVLGIVPPGAATTLTGPQQGNAMELPFCTSLLARGPAGTT